MNNFWRKFKKPFLALAPMEDVTDAAFRRLISQYNTHVGTSDVPTCVMFTEFTSADGLVLANDIGKEKLKRKLIFHENERPIVAQFFTSVPQYMEYATRLARELGFDGVDINMGCPDKSIEKRGAGASLIKNPKLAVEIIRSAKKGAESLPVSVKTRLGYNKDELEEWLPVLLDEGLSAITIHARTRKEMSKVSARWDRVSRAVEIRNEMNRDTLIIGNGDVLDMQDAVEKHNQTKCDGVMIGRSAIGNPWIFTNDGHPMSIISKYERLNALKRHLRLFIEIFGDSGHFPPMKKHMSKYVVGFDGAKELRIKLMQTKSAQEALDILTVCRE